MTRGVGTRRHLRKINGWMVGDEGLGLGGNPLRGGKQNQDQYGGNQPPDASGRTSERASIVDRVIDFADLKHMSLRLCDTRLALLGTLSPTPTSGFISMVALIWGAIGEPLTIGGGSQPQLSQGVPLCPK